MRRPRALTIIASFGCLHLLPSSASAIPRSEIVAAAPAFEEHEWTCAEENLVAQCADDTWQPSVTSVGPKVGLPYCWGGWVTIDEFDQQISGGYGAGSLPEGEFPDCTTGLDCSGYVSQLWQYPTKLGTRQIPSESKEIDITALRPGDVLNKSGEHVVMFLGEDENGDAIVTESTTAPECMGVCRRSLQWSAFGEDYIPRAYLYADLKSSAQAGTADDPIRIDTLPYVDERSTEGAQSDRFDTYATAPETDESGPELIYVLEAASGGMLTAALVDSPGVDVDIHLLSSLDAADCLARGDRFVAHKITEPGTYYIVVDTFVGDGGTEYSGTYQLRLDIVGGELKPPPPTEDGCDCGLASGWPTAVPAIPILLLLALRRAKRLSRRSQTKG